MYKKAPLFLIIVMFIIGISKISFAMNCDDNASHDGHLQLTQVSSKNSINVGNKICPVSGEKIEEKMKATYEYNGKVYNFCCASCIAEFKEHPDKYIKKVNAELQSSGAPTAEHGTMHH